ncbi:MAG: Chemotaxis response regulator protein-glutamate methylesterase [Anaerolineae bacterium]|nr:Chemotaxis response regulator protein-glutamate methylesterase [Anaerolineae bacterium]
MINVLIVDDSAVSRQHLQHILAADEKINVLATASNGDEAIKLAARLKPNVITMDIHMPGLDGIEATRKIMQTSPVPIIIVSANWTAEEVAMTFSALEAGAVTLVEKPVGLGHPRYEAMAHELRQTVKLMSEVKVVRRWARYAQATAKEAAAGKIEPVKPENPEIELVVMGVSTGGPPVLHAILGALPRDFSLPILIVQHIAAGFLPGLVDWLSKDAALPIRIAGHGWPLQPGHVYFAPDDWHMGVNRQRQIVLERAARENSLRPAISYLFRSALETFGPHAAGVLLTGMGKDGAQELRHMLDQGAVTIAQNKETCVVYGMPGEAAALGAAKHILPPNKIVSLLVWLARQQKVQPF